MKYISLYRIPITYLLFYVIAILMTGVWLFLLSQGLQSSEGLGALFLDIIAKPEVKSLHNFVEVAAPHMFAMAAMKKNGLNPRRLLLLQTNLIGPHLILSKMICQPVIQLI